MSWIITGTPSIGKTFFGFRMFYKIHESNGNAVILQTISQNKHIFHLGGFVEEVDYVPSSVTTSAENWIIAHAVLPIFEGGGVLPLCCFHITKVDG